MAFPASSSCRGLGLSTLFLNGLQGNHGGFWRSPGKPCRGALQLPVHEFGILGYPYSSTPTGAPGPGPHTVPSVVGPGPKQGTGTRGAWVMPNLTPYPPHPPQRHASITASWGRSWVVLYSERAQRPPPPPYKQGKQGYFPYLRHSLLQSQKPPPPSSASKVEREQRSTPVAAATTSAVDLPHHLRHASEAWKGEGHEGRDRESCEVDRSATA